MADLVSAADIKTWLGISDTTDDTVLAYIAGAASGQTRSWCGRSFHVDAGQVASARYFNSLDERLCWIDDAYEITAVATDDADNGAWSTVWSASDYTLDPLDGVGPTGETGWPYTRIIAVESRTFPVSSRPNLKITAKWGWSALPDDVFTATLMIASELFRSKSGGFDVFNADGNFTPIRRNAVVRDLLAPYRTSRANDARFLVL